MAGRRQPRRPMGTPAGGQWADADTPEGRPLRPESFLDVAEFSRWQSQAASAASVARIASEAGHFEWACFMAEQAAQIAVKGLLHGIGAEAWGHDLTVLATHAAEALGAAWPGDLADPAARLSRHYIPARYPDAHPSGPPSTHYLPSDAERALGDMSRLVEAVTAAWQSLAGP